VFGWPRRDKPIVYIGSGGVNYNPAFVKVVDERDYGATATSLSVSDIVARNLALRRSLESLVGHGGIIPIAEPPPETVESVLNKFTEAGHDRPEVVITGNKMANGREEWRAIIDLDIVATSIGFGCHLTTYSSAKEVDDAVIKELNSRLSGLVVETTTITYE